VGKGGEVEIDASTGGVVLTLTSTIKKGEDGNPKG